MVVQYMSLVCAYSRAPFKKSFSILITIKWALEEKASPPARIVFSLFSVILPITLLAVAFSAAL